MDVKHEAAEIIRYGCELAGQLESNLPNLVENPSYLLVPKIEKIVRTFNEAMVLLGYHSHNPSSSSSSPPSSSYAHMILGQSSVPPRHELGFSRAEEDLLRGALTQPMDLLRALGVGMMSGGETGMLEAPQWGLEVPVGGSGRKLELALGGMQVGYVGSRDVHAMQMEESDSIRSPSHRVRTRKESRETLKERVPAPVPPPGPNTGNAEVVPEDGYTWRKYGQKTILNSKFPRSYYRCAYKNLGCVAKKKVQRMDEDPYMMEITYHFHHTCQTPSLQTPSLLPSSSSTRAMFEAPRPPPPPPPPPPPSTSTSIRLGSWISGEFEVDHKEKNDPDESHVPVHSRQEGGSGTGESSSVHVEASHVRDVSVREEPVENIADFLFNSGSSDNSMDSIFSLKPE